MLRTLRKLTNILIRDCRGMTSIEASVIIPLIFWIVGMCICFFLFLIDMAAVKSEVQRVSCELAQGAGRDVDLYDGSYDLEAELNKRIRTGWKDEVRLEEKGQGRLRRRLTQRLCMARIGETEVSEGAQEVRVYAAINFTGRFPAFAGSRGRWTFRAGAVSLPAGREEALLGIAAGKEREKRGESK